MAMLTADSIDPMRNGDSACAGVHHVAPLPEDPALLQHMPREAQAEIMRLQMLIAVLLGNRFGRRSERLGEEALQQGGEDIEQSLAEQAAKLEAAQPAAERLTMPPKRNTVRCQNICRGWRSWSISPTRPVDAVLRRCMRSAKTGPRCLITSPRRYAFR